MDNKKKIGHPDRDLISLEQVAEVKRWTKVLGVSEAQLRKAVREVGHSVKKVREYLSKR